MSFIKSLGRAYRYFLRAFQRYIIHHPSFLPQVTPSFGLLAQFVQPECKVLEKMSFIKSLGRAYRYFLRAFQRYIIHHPSFLPQVTPSFGLLAQFVQPECKVLEKMSFIKSLGRAYRYFLRAFQRYIIHHPSFLPQVTPSFGLLAQFVQPECKVLEKMSFIKSLGRAYRYFLRAFQRYIIHHPSFLPQVTPSFGLLAQFVQPECKVLEKMSFIKSLGRAYRYFLRRFPTVYHPSS